MDTTKQAFLGHFSKHGNVGRACRQTGISRLELDSLLTTDPAFRQAVDDAEADLADDAEDEMRRRAVEGVEETVYYKGGPVFKLDPITGEPILGEDGEAIAYKRRVYSDSLLLKYVEAKKPGVFNRNKEPSAAGSRLHVKEAMDLTRLTREQREQLRVMLDSQDVSEASQGGRLIASEVESDDPGF